jgi:hypothetical protein
MNNSAHKIRMERGGVQCKRESILAQSLQILGSDHNVQIPFIPKSECHDIQSSHFDATKLVVLNNIATRAWPHSIL